MIEEKVRKWIKRGITALEIALAMILLVGIVSGIPDLFKYIPGIYSTSSEWGYVVFGDFIRHVLLLVVGLELMLMITTHSNESILTLVLFVIARKLLVYAEGMTDILIGAIAVAIIFAVLIIMSRDSKLSIHCDSTFPSGMTIKLLTEEYGYKFPTFETLTLGGFIVKLAAEQGIDIKRNTVMEHAGYLFSIEKLRNGVVEKVKIKEIEN